MAIESPPGAALAQLQRRRAWVRRLALVAAGLMLATIVLSAFMRLSSSGLGCADWPACYGQALRDASPATPSAGVATARLAHRVVATAVLLLALVLAASTLATRPLLLREGRLALATLALVFALAALGVVSAGATLPAVTLGNLLGGFGTLALCWRLAAPPEGPVPTLQTRRWARLALVLLLLQAALGALVSASHSALACSALADCVRSVQASGWHWQLLNPWLQPVLDASPPFNPRGATLQLLHRGGALLLLAALAAVALAARRQGLRREAPALALLLGLQLLSGALLADAGWPLLQVLLHNATAALLLARLARLV